MEYLYHGSKVNGLTILSPKEAGHKDAFVYAVSELAFAVIFINRPGGSLLQGWGRNKNTGIPYLVEKKEGTIDINYKNIPGSIYVVRKELFFQTSSLWKEEWISKKSVEVVEEIKIINLKEYLLNLERENKLEITYFKDRLINFPNIDNDAIKDARELITKYGNSVIESIKKYRPEILDKVIINN
ncbi:MAG: hypothetical protein WCO84_00640 [bacterium]